MKNEAKGFGLFLRRERNAAANAYASGNAELVRQLSPARGAATFLGPGGGAISGAEKVNRTNAKGAKHFGPGGTSSLKVLQSAASDTLAFWTGFQNAKVRMAGKPGMIPMTLRVTEVFRKEKSGWKMIHRHADMLAKPQKGPK